MFNLKELFAFIGIIILLGIGGFLYNNIMQQSWRHSENNNIICTQDTRVCPNGSVVKRIPTTCNFAICPQKQQATTTQATTTQSANTIPNNLLPR